MKGRLGESSFEGERGTSTKCSLKTNRGKVKGHAPNVKKKFHLFVAGGLSALFISAATAVVNVIVAESALIAGGVSFGVEGTTCKDCDLISATSPSFSCAATDDKDEPRTSLCCRIREGEVWLLGV